MTDNWGNKCFCGKPLPDIWSNIRWCDQCLEEWATSNSEEATTFIERKKAEARERTQKIMWSPS